MTGTIRFTDLLGLETAPGRSMTLEIVNPGILVENGVIRYQLLPDQLVKIERGEWPFMGGRLILQETILNFGRPSPKRLTFEVVGLDAKTFVDSMGFKELAATGTFDGVLPMIFDDEGGRIVGGRLDSREGGGTLAYNGVVNRANLGMMGGFAFDALRDLKLPVDDHPPRRLSRRRIRDADDDRGGRRSATPARSVHPVGQPHPVQFQCDDQGTVPRPDRHRQELPRPDPGDRAGACRGRSTRCPGIVVETRRREESQQQTPDPGRQKITPTPTQPAMRMKP